MSPHSQPFNRAGRKEGEHRLSGACKGGATWNPFLLLSLPPFLFGGAGHECWSRPSFMLDRALSVSSKGTLFSLFPSILPPFLPASFSSSPSRYLPPFFLRPRLWGTQCRHTVGSAAPFSGSSWIPGETHQEGPNAIS